MKITLISTDEFISSHGIRQVSSYLKKNDHSTQLVFLPMSLGEVFPGTVDYSKTYPQRAMEELINLTRGSGLIGISSTAASSDRAIQVLKTLKTLKIPIIWGGIYPTTCAEECLEYADMVCIGEGEEAMLELADRLQNKDYYYDIRNLWFKRDGQIIKNPLRPLIQDLDSLPFPDYEIETQYILKQDRIIRMHERHLSFRFLRCFLIHTTRGCPFSCSFCCNKYLEELYPNEARSIRKRSITGVIEELVRIKKRFPSICWVWFTDDIFCIRPIEEIREFSQQYKKRIDLPFRIYVNPRTLDQAKLDMLFDAGLRRVEMGIQTGSERINRYLYNRPTPNEQVINSAQLLSKYQLKMDSKATFATYQIIYANPYEDKEDLMQTIRLLQRLPKPYFLDVFGLVFFPGTELYQRAREDGLIKKREDSAYNLCYCDGPEHIKLKRKNIYLNSFLFWMQGEVNSIRYGALPSFLFDSLLKERVIRFSEQFSHMYYSISQLVELARDTFYGFRLWWVKKSLCRVYLKVVKHR